MLEADLVSISGLGTYTEDEGSCGGVAVDALSQLGTGSQGPSRDASVAVAVPAMVRAYEAAVAASLAAATLTAPGLQEAVQATVECDAVASTRAKEAQQAAEAAQVEAMTLAKVAATALPDRSAAFSDHVFEQRLFEGSQASELEEAEIAEPVVLGSVMQPVAGLNVVGFEEAENMSRQDFRIPSPRSCLRPRPVDSGEGWCKVRKGQQLAVGQKVNRSKGIMTKGGGGTPSGSSGGPESSQNSGQLGVVGAELQAEQQRFWQEMWGLWGPLGQKQYDSFIGTFQARCRDGTCTAELIRSLLTIAHFNAEHSAGLG